MDTPIADMAQMSPFALMRERGLSPIQVLEIQTSLQAEGLSLWDWHSFTYLYKDMLPKVAKEEKSSSSSKDSKKKTRSPSPKATEKKTRPANRKGLEKLSYDITGSCGNALTIAKYVTQLSDLQREAIELMYMQRQSARAVAKRLGMREGAVYGRKQMAVRKLKALWQKDNVLT